MIVQGLQTVVVLTYRGMKQEYKGSQVENGNPWFWCVMEPKCLHILTKLEILDVWSILVNIDFIRHEIL